MFYQQTDDEKKYSEATNSAILAYPSVPDFYALQGLFLQSNEQYEQAIALFITASQKHEVRDESENYRFMAVYQIGRTAVLAKNWLQQGHDALTDYLQNAPVDRKLPNKEWATFRLAQILHYQGSHSEAKSLLKLLLKSDDDDLKSKSKRFLKTIT